MQSEQFGIRLKLLSGDNVILAKCDGLTTEVFMPAIIEGRISIVNVIPQRRCNCFSTTHLVAKRRSAGQPIDSPSDTLSNWRVSLSSTFLPQQKKVSSSSNPLANSTPAVQMQASSRNSSNLRYISPEVVRRAFTEVNSPLITPSIAALDKSLQLNQFENIQYPNENFRYSVSPAISVINNTTSAGNLYSLRWPQMPSLVHPPNQTTIPILQSPERPWRKVLTPTRTYARRNYSPNTTYLDRLPDNHLNNPTQGPTTDHIVKFKIYKVAVDQKIGISPRSFKQQFEGKSAAIQCEEFREERRKLFSSINRPTAFDLLTTTSFNRKSQAESLKKLFRKRCVNKASSTYPKYKKLCAIDSLETIDKRSNNNASALRAAPTTFTGQEHPMIIGDEQIEWAVPAPRNFFSKSIPRIQTIWYGGGIPATSTLSSIQGARKSLFPSSK